MALTKRTTEAGGVKFDLHEGGSGPALLFLHDGEGVSGSLPILERLAASFRVVAPSMPGFGTSSLPAWIDRADDFAYPLLDLIEQSKLTDVVLTGASFGGWVAAEMAAKTCERLSRLVLVAPLGIKVGSRDQLDMPDLFAKTVEEGHELMFANPENAKRDFSKFSDEELASVARSRETIALTAWDPYMHNPKLRHRLHRISVPTLVLRGAEDAFTPASYTQSFANLIPQSRLQAISGGGHFVHIEKPAEVAEAIEGFAARAVAQA